MPLLFDPVGLNCGFTRFVSILKVKGGLCSGVRRCRNMGCACAIYNTNMKTLPLDRNSTKLKKR